MPALRDCGYLPVGRGQRIRFARFAAGTEQPRRGTILLLSGRNEMIEKAFETIIDFAAMGFETVTFDWRGQGGSSRLLRNRNKGYLDSFDTWQDDIETVLKQVVLPDCRAPYYLVAHSSGSLAALYAGPALSTRISRMVLLSPFVGFGPLPLSPGWIRTLARWMVVLGLGSQKLWGRRNPDEAGAFAGNALTSDEERFRRNQQLVSKRLDLALGGPTAAWVDAAARAMDRVNRPSHYARIKTPTLIIAAGADTVVSAPAGARLGKAMHAASALTIDGARHELLQEADIFREQALAAIDAFLQE